MIKAMIWDIGGVLFPHQPWAGKKPPLEDRLQVKQVVIDIYDEGKMSKDYLKQELFKSDLPKETLQAAYNALTVIDDDLFDLIKKLGKKYDQYAMANEVQKWTDIRDHIHGIKSVFKKTYVSIDVGMTKPDPKFFMHILEENKLKPEECIFVDDKDVNVESAREISINAIQYHNFEQLKTDLEKYI